MIAPYDLIQTADRPVFLPSGNDGQMRRLVAVIGRPELADDPRFRTNQARVRNRASCSIFSNPSSRSGPRPSCATPVGQRPSGQ